MPLFSRRLPHVLTRADLARAIAPTYAKAASVEVDEALDRMERALASQRVVDELYAGVSAALVEAKGPRTSEDELIDKLSAGVQARRARVRAAELTPAISAVMVLLNLELGYAPEMMRNALQGEKGRALLQDGLRALGAHFLKELIR
jgi:allophanate hydrolase subunit 1